MLRLWFHAPGPRSRDDFPVQKFNVKKQAVVGVTRVIQWWRKKPVLCKFVNWCKMPARIPHGIIFAHMVAINTQDAERFSRLFNAGPCSSDRSSPFPTPDKSAWDTLVLGRDPVASTGGLILEDADCRWLGDH